MPENLESILEKFIIALEKQSLVASNGLSATIFSENYSDIVGARMQYSVLSGLLMDGTGCRYFMELKRDTAPRSFLDRYALQFAVGYYSLSSKLNSIHDISSQPLPSLRLDDFKEVSSQMNYSEFRDYAANCVFRKEYKQVVDLIKFIRSDYKKPSVQEYTDNFKKPRNPLRKQSLTAEPDNQDNCILKRILRTRQTYPDLFSS